MRVRFILEFLLILLVSVLFSVSNRFFVTSDYLLLQVYSEENRLNTVYPCDSIQQERLPVNLEAGRIYF